MPATSSILGRCEYNGYVFNNTTRTTGVTVDPEFDDSKRVAVACVWRIELETYITATTSTDLAVRDAVHRLTHPAGQLVYEGRGLGNPNVNTSKERDLQWGPIPGPVKLSVSGTGNAVKLSWSVSFKIACCDNANYQFFPLAIGYTVAHEGDEAGYTTRRIEGYIRVPMTRRTVNDPTLTDSADNYRAWVSPPLLRGFRRVYGPWKLSADRTRLDFSISDEQMGGEPLPPNVAGCDLTETVSSSQIGLRHWTHSFHGTYRMRVGASGYEAAQHFLRHVNLQFLRLKKELKGLPEAFAIVPISFSATNPNRKGKTTGQFQMACTYGTSLPYLMKIAGLWTQVGIDTWQTWATSLLTTGLDLYGSSKLSFTIKDENLIGLCEPVAASTGSSMPLSPTAPPPADPQDGAPVTMASLMQTATQMVAAPDPATSWITYENELWVEVDSGTVFPRTLPQAPLTKATDVFGSVADFAGPVVDALTLQTMPAAAGGPPPASPGSATTPVATTNVQRRVTPKVFVFLRGHAVRAGYAIDPPRLVTVNGVEAVPAGRLDMGEGFARSVKLNGGVPIHICRWNFRYYLPSVPVGPMPIPTNPMKGAT